MKHHLQGLDGLRGVAALCVVVFHLQEIAYPALAPTGWWLRHAALAVDFFFCLSGYVIGYAYQERRAQMGLLGYVKARLVRLHPMVIFGAILGLGVYVLDPFAVSEDQSFFKAQDAPFWMLTINLICAALAMPAPSLPNRPGFTFSLNAPAWSLFWEYVASFAFGLILWRLKRWVLALLVVAAAVGVVASALEANAVTKGWAWGEEWHALTRTTFAFCTGLLLYRCEVVFKSSIGFLALSGLMVALFLAPNFGELNWLYDSSLALVVFPLFIAIGAGVRPKGLVEKLCEWLGRLSYPLYITHYAIVMPFMNYFWVRNSVSLEALPWVIGALTLVCVGVAYLALVLYDEPLRRRINRRGPAAETPVGILKQNS